MSPGHHLVGTLVSKVSLAEIFEQENIKKTQVKLVEILYHITVLVLDEKKK